MITPDYIRIMAVYSHWQNDSLAGAADTLSDAARKADRGAFFRSIHETFNHVLWADQIWMMRLAGTAIPEAKSIPESVRQHEDWDAFRAARQAFDAEMMDWSRRVTPEDISGDLSWYSGAAKREITKPWGLLLTHMFNHGTHHRGQIHAMLTAAGAKPDDTDLPFMPKNYLAMLD